MINLYGGTPGIREIKLLESAIAQPRATFAGSFVHKTIPEMAAAYFFHIIKITPLLMEIKELG
jgi:death-on-curing protein